MRKLFMDSRIIEKPSFDIVIDGDFKRMKFDCPVCKLVLRDLEDVESCAKGIPNKFGAQVKNPKRLNSSSKSIPKSSFLIPASVYQ